MLLQETLLVLMVIVDVLLMPTFTLKLEKVTGFLIQMRLGPLILMAGGAILLIPLRTSVKTLVNGFGFLPI